MTNSTVSPELVRYPVTVTRKHGKNYGKLFKDLLARGDYGFKNSCITPTNFRGECISSFEGVLVHFDRDIKSNDAVKELDLMGLRPATMLELLAFGVKYPKKQREFPIAALDKSWFDIEDGYLCGYLDGEDTERVVRLNQWVYGWGPAYRFLAVPMEKPALS